MNIIVERFENVTLVRDTLLGGTKARYAWQLFAKTDQVVYASSAEGGAQTSLAYCAKRWGKKVTIFAAARAQQHPRQIEAQRLGAKYEFVRPGYLNVVQARARAFAEARGALLAPWGMKCTNAVNTIAEAASALEVRPDYVWCAVGSGTLANGLRLAWPGAELHCVKVGADVEAPPGAIMHESPLKYSQHGPAAGFDCCPHYEAKAFAAMKAWLAVEKPKGANVLFWVPMPSAKANDMDA